MATLHMISDNSMKNIREAAKVLPFKVSISRKTGTKRTRGSISIRPTGRTPWTVEQAESVLENLVKPNNLKSDFNAFYGYNTSISGYFYLFQER